MWGQGRIKRSVIGKNVKSLTIYFTFERKMKRREGHFIKGDKNQARTNVLNLK